MKLAILILCALAFLGCSKQEVASRPPFVVYTQVVGDSMLPTYKSGEIVTLELCDYQSVGAGATVIFWHEEIKTFLHHRLVGRDHTGRWITRGDNNPGIDRGHMSRADFVGRTRKWP